MNRKDLPKAARIAIKNGKSWNGWEPQTVEEMFPIPEETLGTWAMRYRQIVPEIINGSPRITYHEYEDGYNSYISDETWAKFDKLQNELAQQSEKAYDEYMAFCLKTGTDPLDVFHFKGHVKSTKYLARKVRKAVRYYFCNPSRPLTKLP